MSALGHKTGDYYAALDGFRGLLAVFVAIYHTIWLSHPNQWAFFDNGPVIIDLFFALSGFLMWRIYADRLKDGADVVAFMKKRFARLYPLHLFMLVVFLGFAVLRLVAHKVGIAETTPGEVLPFEAGAPENWASLLQNLTLTHAFGLEDSLTFNPPAWTIGAEFWAYLLFAALMTWHRPTRLLHFVMIGVGVAALYALLSRLGPDMNMTYDYGFLRCVAGFFTGVLAAATFEYLRPRAAKLSFGKFTIIEVMLLIGSTLFVIYCGGRAQFFVAPVLFAFILLFAFDGGAVSRFMSHGVFRYLAKISYSVYMTHVIVAIGFGIILKALYGSLPTGYPADVWLLIYLGVVIAVSHLTWRYVEMPGGRWLRNARWPQKRVAKAEPSV